MIFTVGFYGEQNFAAKQSNSAKRRANGIKYDYLVSAMRCNKVKTHAKNSFLNP